jgi:hypothetical protein
MLKVFKLSSKIKSFEGWIFFSSSDIEGDTYCVGFGGPDPTEHVYLMTKEDPSFEALLFLKTIRTLCTDHG